MSNDAPEKLTPFTSKANEIARNFALISDALISNSQVLSQLNSIMTDLIILADELDLEEGEIEHIAEIVQDGMEKVQEIHTQMTLSDKEVRECIVELFGSEGLEPFMERKVVNPYDPIFTYKESSMSSSKLAKKIALKFAQDDSIPSLEDQLIRLGSTNPKLREHIRPVLTKIAVDTPKYLLMDLMEGMGNVERDLKDIFGSSAVEGPHTGPYGMSWMYNVTLPGLLSIGLQAYNYHKTEDLSGLRFFINGPNATTLFESKKPTAMDWVYVRDILGDAMEAAEDAGVGYAAEDAFYDYLKRNLR